MRTVAADVYMADLWKMKKRLEGVFILLFRLTVKAPYKGGWVEEDESGLLYQPNPGEPCLLYSIIFEVFVYSLNHIMDSYKCSARPHR